jgi:hypothetical protein
LRVAGPDKLQELAQHGPSVAIPLLTAAYAAVRKNPKGVLVRSAPPSVTTDQVADWLLSARDAQLAQLGERNPDLGVTLVSAAYVVARAQASKSEFALEIEDVLRRYSGSSTLQTLNGP